MTQRPGVISFAGGLPAEELMPTLDFTGLADCRQYGPSEGGPALRGLIAQSLSVLGELLGEFAGGVPSRREQASVSV